MNPSSGFQFKMERDFGQVMSVTFAFFQEHFRQLAKITLFILGPVIVCYSVYETFMLYQFKTAHTEGVFFLDNLLATQAPVILVYLFVDTFYGTLIYHYLDGCARGDSQVNNLETLFKTSIRNYLPFVAMTFLTSLIVVVSLVTIIGPFYLGIAMLFIYIIRVHEKRSIFQSIERSFSLISGNWWETFGIYMIFFAISAIIAIAASLPLTILTQLIELNTIQNQDSTGIIALQVFLGIIANLGNSLAWALFLIAITFQYFSLRESSEMTGLYERIAAIGERQSPSQEAGEVI